MSSGHEGRIGMVAVVLKEGKEFDGVDACRVVVNYLPVYARPWFVRIRVSHVYIPLLLIALHCFQSFFVSNSSFSSKCISLSEFFGNHRNFQDEKGEAGGGGL